MTGRNAAVLLAAGKGKRMQSDLPKVLHPIGTKPIIRILLDRLLPLGFEQIVIVIGHKGELIQEALASYPVSFAWQREQLGTAHAVAQAHDFLADFDGTTMIAAGDVPFLSINSIRELFRTQADSRAAATCLSARFENPSGYGRIIRDRAGKFLEAIVEEKDASAEQKAITEVNSGTFCFDNRLLFDAISKIGNRNAQGEYYLTDAVAVLNGMGKRVAIVEAENPNEVLGVNSQEQLQELATIFSHLVP